MKNIKTFAGIALLLTFGGLLSISIINQSIKPMGVVLLLALFIIGIHFLWIGRKITKKEHPANQSNKTMSVISPSQNEKNLEKNKQEIEDYGKFLAQVYLCASHNTFGNQTDYICINKETAELYSFSAKVIGRSGAFDQYVFSKQPQKITTYTQLMSNLHANAKKLFHDLCESNWENYFRFMLCSPEHSGATLSKQLLSCDTGVVRNAVFAVHNLVLKPPKERRDFLTEAYQSFSLIKQNLESLDMGGMFAQNSRFNNRAIRIIEGNNTDQCFCRLLIDEFGPSANGLAKKGFLLIQEDEKINDYSVRGIIECPVCHKQYSIIEEYTGWHIPTIIHCSEIPKTDLNQTRN